MYTKGKFKGGTEMMERQKNDLLPPILHDSHHLNSSWDCNSVSARGYSICPVQFGYTIIKLVLNCYDFLIINFYVPTSQNKWIGLVLFGSSRLLTRVRKVPLGVRIYIKIGHANQYFLNCFLLTTIRIFYEIIQIMLKMNYTKKVLKKIV